MPTYEYACDRCGIVEVFQSIKAKALSKCPQCKTAKVSRLISGGSGVVFTGSGFWETDYNRSSDYRAKTKQESTTPATTTSESPATATPKPAPGVKPSAIATAPASASP